MAKSDAASTVISLPKGGGAIRGIGETFSPDLFTGTGNFSIPIALPPGRNGFQPELHLVYSTGNGNGPFGLGWDLSVPGVSRKASKGVPRYRDAEDVFILSGAEDLVPVAGDPSGPVRYRPRTEGLFASITFQRDENLWEVESKDGLVSYYGRVPDNPFSAPAVLADPSAPEKRVFAWKLVRTRDSFGNRIEYEYERDRGEENGHHWDQLYLKQIRYTEYKDATGTERFLVSVTFNYDTSNARPDPFSDYRAGFEIRTRRRCKSIVVATRSDKTRRVRTYELTYLDERVAEGELSPEHLPLNGISLLSQIRAVGHDDEQAEPDNQRQELPPLEFRYSRFTPRSRRFFAVKGKELPARSLASPDLTLADLFGNGLPDILQMNGVMRYWRNLGGGRFDLPREMKEAPAGLVLSDPGVQLVDADGDARIDLLVTSGPLAGYYPTRPAGLWDKGSFQPYRFAPSFNLQDPEVALVDLDGDGVTDAIRSGTRLECFFNDPREGWNNTRFVTRGRLEDFPNVNFSDPRVRFADVSGDGLQDIVLSYDGNVEYWPNLGHGNWGKRRRMENSPRFPFGYDPRRILLGDVDGDGLADLVYVDHSKVLLFINQAGNRWSDPIEIRGTPGVTDTDAVSLVDLLGNGVSGILWSADATLPGRPHMFFLDLTGGVKPYLLNEMDNWMGALTRVEYAPSTRFYLEDRSSPKTRWKTSLPFPVQTVARVEVVDALSRGKLTTEYHYRHGYWDGGEREFRGFGRVDQCDTEIVADYHAGHLHPVDSFELIDEKFFSPPTETRTWFHLGPIGEEFGEWVPDDFSHIDFHDEFFGGDPSLVPALQAQLPSTSAQLGMLQHLPRRVKRDAIRALRGRIMRTELYMLDGTDSQERPFTVTEALHGVCGVLDVGDESELVCDAQSVPAAWRNEAEARRVFFPHTIAQRTTQWERGNDPMTRFSFTEDYNTFGQPRQETQIACPRRWRHLEDRPGEPYLATHTQTDFAEPEEGSDAYIRDRAARATIFEIKNGGSGTVLDLKQLADAEAAPEIVGQTLNYYDGPAFVGLPYGTVGGHGALVRSEALVLTENILQEAYKSGETVADPLEIPPYLLPEGTPPWPPEYPEGFRKGVEGLPQLAGYTFHAGDDVHERGYFATTTRNKYDFQDDSEPPRDGSEPPHRGLLKVIRAPLGDELGSHDTAIEYDEFDLLPTKVTDPIGLVTKARYDPRVLQPHEVTDPNGNRTRFAYTPLGLLAHIAVMGKEGEPVGDSDEVPGTRFEYELRAFMDGDQPVSVRAIQRVHHVNDDDVPLPERDETIETVEYSDGFGRVIQTRTLAEDVIFGDAAFGGGVLPADQSIDPGSVIGRKRAPGDPPNVTVSGWQVYDNKGRVVEKLEPFFDQGFSYLSLAEAKEKRPELFGQKATMFYDPLGRVVRTLNPDGSEQRVVFGVPGSIAAPDLNSPDVFEPTPWEAYTYDANDLAPLSKDPATDEPLTDRAPRHHHFTPSSVLLDPLGRTVLAVERNREASEDTAGPLPPIEEIRTASTYDIRGNLLTVTDALDREAFRYTYDLADNPLRIESIDAGRRRIVLDAAGNEVERRDRRDDYGGALVLQAYDRLHRPIQLWARDDGAGTVTLRERLEYGDGSTPEQPTPVRASNRALNRLGVLHRHYDEAGLLEFESYDFKGNVVEKSRRVIGDEAILSVFPSAGETSPDWSIAPFRVEWEPPAGVPFEAHAEALLASARYATSLRYDALNRITMLRSPLDVEGRRRELRPAYNRAGALESVTFDDEVFVEGIAYDAKGQRTLIVLGNDIMTRYAYEPQTFRLARLRSERYTRPDPDAPTYAPSGAPLQDFAYEYDLAGNIVAIRDRAPGSGVGGTDALDRRFSYDPLYRLLSATGREHDREPPFPVPPWLDELAPAPPDPTKTRAYEQSYRYDKAGNLEELGHNRGRRGAFVRKFGVGPASNRLNTLTVGTETFGYRYDANGNLVQENTERHFEWDHSDRMRVFRNQVDDGQPSVHAHYLYDAGGQRVMKLVRKQGGRLETTVYIDGLFEHHSWKRNGALPEQNNQIHVMDDAQRIAMVRVGPAHPKDRGPPVQYHLGDHLGSSNLVVSRDGSFINGEEHYPYGETSFGSFACKRYRFTGKERDEESSFYYHGARYYAPWVGRWLNCDPAGMVDGINRYQYVNGNPIRLTDPSGNQGEEEVHQQDQYGIYWHYESGGAGRTTLEGETYYYPPGSEMPTHILHNGEWNYWDPIGEVITINRTYKESLAGRIAGGIFGWVGENVLVPTFQLAFGGSSTNAPRQSYTEQGANVAITVGGGKLLGKGWSWLKNKWNIRRAARAGTPPTATAANASASAGAGKQANLSVDQVLFQLRDEATALTRQLGPLTPQKFGSVNDAIFKSLVKNAVEEGRLPSSIRTSLASLNRPGSRGIDVWDTAAGIGWDLTTATQRSVISHDIRYINRATPDGTMIIDVRPLVYRRF